MTGPDDRALETPADADAVLVIDETGSCYSARIEIPIILRNPKSVMTRRSYIHEIAPADGIFLDRAKGGLEAGVPIAHGTHSGAPRTLTFG